MVKRRKINSAERRSWSEYVLMLVAVSLFLFGIWAYRAGSKLPANSSQQMTAEPGTTQDIESLAEDDSNLETSLESDSDKFETVASDDMEAAADAASGAYDETTY